MLQTTKRLSRYVRPSLFYMLPTAFYLLPIPSGFKEEHAKRKRPRFET